MRNVKWERGEREKIEERGFSPRPQEDWLLQILNSHAHCAWKTSVYSWFYHRFLTGSMFPSRDKTTLIVAVWNQAWEQITRFPFLPLHSSKKNFFSFSSLPRFPSNSTLFSPLIWTALSTLPVSPVSRYSSSSIFGIHRVSHWNHSVFVWTYNDFVITRKALSGKTVPKREEAWHFHSLLVSVFWMCVNLLWISWV